MALSPVFYAACVTAAAASAASLSLRIRPGRALAAAARVRGRIMRRAFVRRADSQLPQVLLFMANSLKAGLSLQQSIAAAADETPHPLGEELRLVLSRQRLGSGLDEALAEMAQRLPTEDVQLMVRSVEVLRRTGGNLVETFSSLAATIEQRRMLCDRIRSLTSQGVAQAVTLLFLPWLLAALLWAVAPDFIAPLFTTRLGAALVALAVIMEIFGAVWMKGIVTIKA